MASESYPHFTPILAHQISPREGPPRRDGRCRAKDFRGAADSYITYGWGAAQHNVDSVRRQFVDESSHTARQKLLGIFFVSNLDVIQSSGE